MSYQEFLFVAVPQGDLPALGGSGPAAPTGIPKADYPGLTRRRKSPKTPPLILGSDDGFFMVLSTYYRRTRNVKR